MFTKTKITLLLFFFCLSVQAQTQDSRWQEGSWSFAKDKQLHASTGALFYTACIKNKMKPWQALAFVTLLGASKEILDSYNTAGTYSDLTYTFAGGLLASLVHYQIYLYKKRTKLKLQYKQKRICLTIAYARTL